MRRRKKRWLTGNDNDKPELLISIYLFFHNICSYRLFSHCVNNLVFCFLIPPCFCNLGLAILLSHFLYIPSLSMSLP